MRALQSGEDAEVLDAGKTGRCSPHGAGALFTTSSTLQQSR